MSSINIHGGINEIGGNKILVESSEAKIWLDFGLSFSKQGLYYDEWNNESASTLINTAAEYLKKTKEIIGIEKKSN